MRQRNIYKGCNHVNIDHQIRIYRLTLLHLVVKRVMRDGYFKNKLNTFIHYQHIMNWPIYHVYV